MHEYMFIQLENWAPLVFGLSGSFGISFDMLVQYSDSQNQWRHRMLVLLRGVVIATKFE